MWQIAFMLIHAALLTLAVFVLYSIIKRLKGSSAPLPRKALKNRK